jgi:hypothetical protein
MKSIAIRRAGMNALAVCPVLLWVIASTVVLAAKKHAMAGSVASVIMFTMVLGTISTVVWLIGWTSAVRVGPSGIIVRNLLYVHSIPWSCVKEITLRDGLEIDIKPSGVVESIQFGGSVIGGFTGYPTYKRAIKKMEDGQRRFASIGDMDAGRQVVEHRFSFPYLTLGCWMVVYFVIALVAY